MEDQDIIVEGVEVFMTRVRKTTYFLLIITVVGNRLL